MEVDHHLSMIEEAESDAYKAASEETLGILNDCRMHSKPWRWSSCCDASTRVNPSTGHRLTSRELGKCQSEKHDQSYVRISRN